MCDPEIETCAADDQLVRPSFWSLFFMMNTYSWNVSVWGVMFLAFFSYITNTMKITDYSQLSSLVSHFFIMTLFTAWSALIFSPAAQTLFIYLIFGSNFFLFRWTDNLGMWFVTKFLPGASFYYKLTVMFYFLWNWFG